ncbi:PREDICTED: uncharacterized protein LOC105624928 [Atta cephalotes]|uniref:Uncharacterized protein n=2 Tax=Atta TaxID=12956 RepID=A0A158NVV1_ATTCE|nr:PREDICTED: uncharacterized protein LOC105624928 [Atta cephalotes]XP_018049670.1 PREDICTED: uncharacterized protein LOC108688085 [Atta colombica]KYM81789.1 hypothetical protein ALC53_07783 [Atta colombica]
MSSATLVKRQLTNVINRFKFEELESAVIPVFPETSWARVRSKLIKNHKNFTVLNVTYIIRDILNNANLNLRDLHDRLTTLEVTDVSRHNHKKIWYGYKLLGLNRELRHLDRQEIQEGIEEEFHSKGLDMNIKAIMYDNIMFISVKEKKKKNITPTYFALFFGQKYFFCSKKNVSIEYIKVIASNLGYNNGKSIKLMGRDLKSLIKLLWIKQQNVLQAEDISQPPVYQPSEPVVSNNGVDYTQSKHRKKYAEQCFGKDPPILEKLIIKGSEESIKHDSIASKLPNNTIRMNWEFRSRNMGKFLTALVERRVFMPPLPEYIANFMIMGKNELTLQTKQ